MLGWSWYGSYGTNRGKVDFHFGEYDSSAYIRIKGGKYEKKLKKPSLNRTIRRKSVEQ